MSEPTKEELNEIFGADDSDWSKEDKGWETSSGQNLSWKFRDNPKIRGVYTGSRTIQTKFGDRQIYTLETPDHVMVDVWETAVLKREFGNTVTGTEVRIEYTGKEQSNSGQPVNTFRFQRKKV